MLCHICSRQAFHKHTVAFHKGRSFHKLTIVERHHGGIVEPVSSLFVVFWYANLLLLWNNIVFVLHLFFCLFLLCGLQLHFRLFQLALIDNDSTFEFMRPRTSDHALHYLFINCPLLPLHQLPLATASSTAALQLAVEWWQAQDQGAFESSQTQLATVASSSHLS